MSWSIGHDSRWGKFGRDIGYGVPAVCDHCACSNKIDRGLSYVCGSDPYGGDHGCGLYFCGKHLTFEDRGDECPQLCERCAQGAPTNFEPKPDVKSWVRWKLTDESWAAWRAENPEEVALMRDRMKASRPSSDTREVTKPKARTTEPKSPEPPLITPEIQDKDEGL